MNRSLRLAAAAFAVAAATLVVPIATPAAAAPCAADDGVSVVVDFNGLSGGVQQDCVAGGGDAASLFAAAGFELTYASRQPGFVCRVNGVPASDPCVNTSPADAFWGLWWSDGDASSWTYSSLGAGSLSVPDGGMVAFSWDDVSGTAPPSASPSHPDAPAPPDPTQPTPDHPDPDGGPSQAPGGGTTTAPAVPGASPSATPTAPGESDTRKRRKRHQDRTPEATDSSAPAAPDASVPATDAGDEGSVAEPGSETDGLPGWVAPALIGALFAVAGVVLLLRARRSRP